MSEPQLSERDVCTKLITPAVERAGWNIQSQVREEVPLTAGRVMVRGRLVARGTAKRADYVLYLKPNLPLAVIEAKEPGHRVGDGMQQALEYADMLGVPFSFSSNGSGFLFSDRTGQASKVETELKLAEFPSPDELWRRFRAWKGLSDASAAIVAQDYHTDASGKAPRYYQQNAINSVMEAVVRGQDRKPFNMSHHTRAWHHYKVRRALKKGQKAPSDGCNAQYCIPDSVHNDYVYTPAWVEFLVRKLADEKEYLTLTSRRTPAQPV